MTLYVSDLTEGEQLRKGLRLLLLRNYLIVCVVGLREMDQTVNLLKLFKRSPYSNYYDRQWVNYTV